MRRNGRGRTTRRPTRGDRAAQVYGVERPGLGSSRLSSEEEGALVQGRWAGRSARAVVFGVSLRTQGRSEACR